MNPLYLPAPPQSVTEITHRRKRAYKSGNFLMVMSAVPAPAKAGVPADWMKPPPSDCRCDREGRRPWPTVPGGSNLWPLSARLVEIAASRETLLAMTPRQSGRIRLRWLRRGGGSGGSGHWGGGV